MPFDILLPFQKYRTRKKYVMFIVSTITCLRRLFACWFPALLLPGASMLLASGRSKREYAQHRLL